MPFCENFDRFLPQTLHKDENRFKKRRYHHYAFFKTSVMSTNDEALHIFEASGALTRGHFILRSGLHSGHFFQCARVGERLDQISRLAALLVPQLKPFKAETVVAPAMGGLVIGQEIARQMGLRFLFVEKNGNSELELRRGFKIASGERILVVEDVITRGGRVEEALRIVREHGGEPVGVGVLVDRSEGKVHFEVPHVALLEMSFPTYEPDKLPPELAALPAGKPGS